MEQEVSGMRGRSGRRLYLTGRGGLGAGHTAVSVRRYPGGPTWGGSVPIQQVVVFSSVEVHDDASSIKQLLVTAGAGDAVVAVSAVASVVELLRLHLATHRFPGWRVGEAGSEGDIHTEL